MPAIENVKLTAALPKDRSNGLADLNYDPDTNKPGVFLVVAEFVPHKVTTDLDTGELTLTLRANSIEELTGVEALRGRELLQNRYARRTGQGATLDFTGTRERES